MRIFRMPGKRESGFTLMELMTTIAVFSILAMIAIPTFMSWLPEMRLNGAARQVMGDLMAARMKAVKLNQRTKVFFDNSSQYRICNDLDNNATVDDGEGDNVLRNIQTNYHDVEFGNTADPVFSPRGTATNRTIIVQNSSDSSKSITITISIAGRVKIN